MLVALLLLACAGCVSTPQAPPPPAQPLRVGAYYWPGMFWVDIAHDQGWFREAGLQVERVDTNADYFDSLDALAQGRLDVVCFSLFDLVRHVARGEDVVMIVASDVSHGAEALIARPGIRGIRDLRGRRVALARGTYLDFVFAHAAGSAGLDEATVRVVDLTAEQAPQALAQGRVDAAMTWEPYASETLEAIRGVRLFDTSESPTLMLNGFCVRRADLTERASDLEALLRVWARADAFIRRDRERALGIVARLNGQSLGQVKAFAAVDRILDGADNLQTFSPASGAASIPAAWRRVNDFLLDRGLVRERIDSRRFLDATLLERALK